MNNEIPIKDYINIAGVFLLVMIIIAIPFYVNISKNNRTTISGVVNKVGNNYVVVVGKDNLIYRLETREKYSVGDKLSISIRRVDRTKKPITGVIESASKIVNTEEVDNEDITSYLNRINSSLDNYTEDKASLVKDGFIDMIDFIFYDKELKGAKFKDLSDDVKLNVLKMAYIIDNKIDSRFSGYKEELSKNSSKIYSDVKTRILVNYLNLTSNVCADNSSICDSGREGLKELKDNFSLTWDNIKSLAGLGTSKVKDWYEIWKTIE